MQTRLEIPVMPAPYKPPPPVDEASFYKTVGIGIAIVLVASSIIVNVVRKLRDRKYAAPQRLVDHEAVTLTGIVRAGASTLTAPLSGRACVAHRSRAYLVGEAGSSEGRGIFGQVPAGVAEQPIVEERTAFMLELSQGGSVAIDGEGLALDMTPQRVVPPAPARERAFLERFGLAAKHERAGFDEVLIAVGAKVAIRGMLRIESDPSAADERGYRDDAPRRMRLAADGETAVKVVRIWDA
jgi:hypothetical protein